MPEDDERPTVEPRTAADFFERAAYLSARARFHEDMAKSSRELAERYQRQGEAMQSGEGPLYISHKSDTLDSPMEAESSGATRSHAQIDPRHEGHKFVMMLKRRRISVKDVSDFLEAKLRRKVARSSVTAWYKDPEDRDYRPIPEDAAVALKDEYAVPISAWPRIRQPSK